MGLLARISTVFKSKINKIVDQMENPQETLDYSYEKQLELLQNVRRNITNVVTSKRGWNCRPLNCAMTWLKSMTRLRKPCDRGERIWPEQL